VPYRKEIKEELVKVNSLVLQQEDGTHLMDLELIAPIEKDLTTSEIIRIINPLLKEKDYHITEMSKKGALEYRIWLMKCRKHGVYKLSQKLVMEDEVEIDFVKETMKLDKAKKELSGISMADLNSEIARLEKALSYKDSMNPKEITELYKWTAYEQERDRRLLLVSEALFKCKVDGKLADFMLKSMRELRGL
jgi:hypothetical protein